MGDYQDYGDEESELANSIREKLSWCCLKTTAPWQLPWNVYNGLYDDK
jgi:hypothetical protein